MEAPKEKSKTLNIKIRHCLLHYLVSQDESLEITDKGGEPYPPEAPNRGPHVDLAVNLNIHDELSDVLAFEGDKENSKKRLRIKAPDGILQIVGTAAGNKMTSMELKSRSLFVASPQEKAAVWLTALDEPGSMAVENRAGKWQWAKIAECDC